MLSNILKWKRPKTKKDESPKKSNNVSSPHGSHPKEEVLRNQIEILEDELRKTKIQLIKTSKEREDYKSVLTKIVENLKKQEQLPKQYSTSLEIAINILDHYQSSFEDSFYIYLDDLYQDFIHLLKARFPKLTTYDLRLATYIKMGLSSTEIAGLLNVLPSSINVSRSRLRKKLNLSSRDELFATLEKF